LRERDLASGAESAERQAFAGRRDQSGGQGGGGDGTEGAQEAAMKPRFKGKTVLVTGAGSGIGETTALAFAKEGGRVAVNDVNPRKAAATVRKIERAGGRALAVPGDVADAATSAQVVAAVLKRFRKLDILVNNAGIGVTGTVLETTEEDWDALMRVNVKSMFLMSRAVLPAMIARKRGVIVNTASIVGVAGVTDRAAYTASKHAVVGLTRAMALDHVRDGIRVNCICPGTTMTPWVTQRISETKDPKATLAAMTARQPMGRLGTPQEIAAGILYLASDDASFATGTALVVDGGFTA
jgi:NAD(P)-dependent dehydrogenase (short-subunit alcohol dehydrogenase family)